MEDLSRDAIAFSEMGWEIPPPAPATELSESLLDALEKRLAALESQIDHLIRTAPTLPDAQQQQCWDYARDVQREIRAAREQLRLAHERAQSKPSS